MEASPSKIKHFLQCRRYWHEGAYGPSGSMAQAGKVFHDAVASHAEAVIACLETAKDPLFYISSEDMDIRADVCDLLALYQSDKNLLPDPATILSVEANDSEFIHPILNKPVYKTDLNKEHMITGIPDRISLKKDYLLIDDWKTGFAVEDDPFQLSCYAVLASDKYNVRKVKARYNYIRLGFSIPFWYDLVDIEHHRFRLLAILQDMAQAEKEKNFPETPCMGCTYCTLKPSCRSYSKALNDGNPPPEPVEEMPVSTAILMDDEIGAREKIFKKASEKYAEYVLAKIGTKGLVEGNIAYSIKEIPMRYEYPLVQMLEVFKQFGMTRLLDQILEVAPGKANGALEKPDVKEELGTRFADFFTAIQLLKKTKAVRRKITQKPAGNLDALQKAGEEAKP